MKYFNVKLNGDLMVKAENEDEAYHIAVALCSSEMFLAEEIVGEVVDEEFWSAEDAQLDLFW